MINNSVFSVLGPIMIGPSSSHTAGAAKIGNVARRIAGTGFTSVDFYLHGSFASTYLGHGTDKALIGGVLGYGSGDTEIQDSYELAQEQNLAVQFIKTDLGNVHPNTVKILFHYPDRPDFSVTGSSVGGGNIIIVNIDGVDVTFTNEHPTLILKYQEQKGMIAYISNSLYYSGFNIETMKTVKNQDLDEVLLIVELNDSLSSAVYNRIREGRNFKFIKYIDVA